MTKAQTNILKAPKKNGRSAWRYVSGGPASLADARIAVLGYEIVIYDQDPKLGGFIRTQIPTFLLPRIGGRRGSGATSRISAALAFPTPREDRPNEVGPGRRL